MHSGYQSEVLVLSSNTHGFSSLITIYIPQWAFIFSCPVLLAACISHFDCALILDPCGCSRILLSDTTFHSSFYVVDYATYSLIASLESGSAARGGYWPDVTVIPLNTPELNWFTMMCEVHTTSACTHFCAYIINLGVCLQSRQYRVVGRGKLWRQWAHHLSRLYSCVCKTQKKRHRWKKPFEALPNPPGKKRVFTYVCLLLESFNMTVYVLSFAIIELLQYFIIITGKWVIRTETYHSAPYAVLHFLPFYKN